MLGKITSSLIKKYLLKGYGPFLWAVLLMINLAQAQPPAYIGWSSSASLVVGTTSDWADLDSSVVITDFPIVVRFDSSTFDFSQAEADGADIRFSKEDETALDYEIVEWNGPGGSTVIWVKMDTIRGNEEQTIKMYFGNNTAVSESNGAAVFAAADGYAGVWHLDEAGNSDSAGYVDISGNDNHGTGSGMTSSSGVAGAIGGAQDFTGSNYIDCGADSSLKIRDAITVSAWINIASDSNGHIVNMGGGWTQPGYSLFKFKGNIRAELQNVQDTTKFFLDNPAPSMGSWHHVGFTWDSTSQLVQTYIDGQLASKTGTFTGSIGEAAQNLQIGNNQDITSNAWVGLIDEARVANTARSAEWMKLTFENQKAGQTLVSNLVSDNCTEDFAVSVDTIQAEEMGRFTVTPTVECALRSAWYLVGDSTLTQVGDGSTVLSDSIGRVMGDTSFTYRLVAMMPSGWDTADVVVEVTPSIANPAFSMVQGSGTCCGIETVEIVPNVSNQAVIDTLDAPANVLNYQWSTSGDSVVYDITDSSLILRRAIADGSITVHLCLDNGGPVGCDSVTVAVTATLANPEFTLSIKGGLDSSWNGQDTIEVVPTVTNLDVIQALPEPFNVLSYSWTKSGTYVYSFETDTSLGLRKSYYSGTSTVKLCMDNGGAPVCDSLEVTIEVPVGVLPPDQMNDTPIELQGNSLIWNVPARIEIWDLKGRLIFNEIGMPGRKITITPQVRRNITQHRNIVKIVPLIQ